jgi:hypothetical protein
MNDLPITNAGDGSSFSMVSRFVGAAVGVAVIGSVFAAVYATNAPGGSGSPPTTGALTAVERAAFSDAAAAGYWVIAAVAAVAAAIAWFALRRVAGEAAAARR